MNSGVKTIPYGVSDFENMRLLNGYYVDNTWGIPLLEALPYQLERYAEDHSLAERWHLKPADTVTLIRLALVFHGEELLFAEEI